MRVFISYRRKDLGEQSEFFAKTLKDRLVERYGRENVFMDTASISPGEHFEKRITDFVAKADVFLAIIGPNWETLMKGRAENEDYVRFEIESALKKDVQSQEEKFLLVPLLVGDAKMPNFNELPESIAALRERNAFRVDTGRDFDSHVRNLVSELDQFALQGLTPPPPGPQNRGEEHGLGTLSWIAIIVVIVLLIGLVVFLEVSGSF